MDLDSDSGENSEEMTKVAVSKSKNSVYEEDSEKNKMKYTCIIDGCLSSFNRPWRLKNHLKVHHLGERPFKCSYDECNKAYTNNAHLRRHILISHVGTVNRTKIDCTAPGCTEKFSSKQNLKKHIQRFHTNVYDCLYCDKNFSNQMNLKTHLHTHKDPADVKCSECGEGFFSHNDLQRHKRRHKTYECPEENCNESYMKWTLLRKHMAEKHRPDYDCPDCHMKFKEFCRFKEHYKSHFEFNQFCCDYPDCNREFKYKRNLIQHQVVVHLGERFTCEKCNRSFTSKQRLKLHHLKPSCEKQKPKNPPPRGADRKPRKDKGIPKKPIPMINKLIGLPRGTDPVMYYKEFIERHSIFGNTENGKDDESERHMSDDYSDNEKEQDNEMRKDSSDGKEKECCNKTKNESSEENESSDEHEKESSSENEKDSSDEKEKQSQDEKNNCDNISLKEKLQEVLPEDLRTNRKHKLQTVNS